MGVKDDILIRQIRDLIMAVLRLRKKKDPPALLEGSGPLLERTIGLSVEAMETLSCEGLLSLLSPGGELDPLRAAAAAQVLLARAHAYQNLLQHERSRRTALLAAALFDALEEIDDVDPRWQGMSELVAQSDAEDARALLST